MKYRLSRVLLILSFLSVCFSCKHHDTGTESSGTGIFATPELRKLSEKIAEDPENARLYFDRGNMLHKLREDTLALSDYKKAASLDSGKAEYFSAVGDLLFEHKDISGSVPWIEQAVKLNPEDPKAHLKIAKLLIYIKDYTKAFAEINTVLRQNTLTPEGYFLKGMIYKDLKDTAKALSSFQTALQVDPAYKDAIVQMGVLYSAQRNGLALKYFENAFRADTSDVFPIYAKAMFYQEGKQYEEAKHAYRDALRRNPEYVNAYFGLGWVLLQQDSLDKALDNFDLAARLDPASYKAFYNRGLCHELKGDKAEALKDYRQAQKLNPDFAEAGEGVKRLSGNQ